MIGRPRVKAAVDPDYPSAWGTCDRCRVRYALRELRYQKAWAGSQLTTLKLRVCEKCLDIPAPFLKTQIIGRDPEPLAVIRPEFTDAAHSYRVTEARDRRTTEADDPRILDGS